MYPLFSLPLRREEDVVTARRAATHLSEARGFDPGDQTRIATAVSEIARNACRYATGAQVQFSVDRDPAAFDVRIEDHGYVALSRTDGHSTSGSLGHGLGAVERQSDFFQIYTQPAGTVSVARVWRTADAAAGRSRYEIGAVHVSKQGEEVCGDDWDWRMREGRTAVLLADGLGHGPAAHEASRDAVAAFRRAHEQPPASVIGDIHQAIRATRGAAVSMIAIDHARGVAQYAGVGNISAVVFHAAGTRQSLVSQNGTAGHIVPRLQEYQYPVPANAMVVLHSDGLASQWDPGAYPGLRTRHPSIIAGILYRDFCRQRDDVTVIVMRERHARAGSGGSTISEKL